MRDGRESGPGRTAAQSTPLARSMHSACDRPVPAPLQRRRGGVAVEVHHPPAVGLLRRRPAAPARPRPPPAANSVRAGPPGNGAKSSGRMNSSSAPPVDVQQPVGRDLRPQAVEQRRPPPGAGAAAASRNWTANASSIACGRARGRATAVRQYAVARASHGCPATAGSAAADPVRRRRDHGGDLQGRRRRVRPGPERRAGGRVGHRQREGQPAVGQRDRRPASRTARPPAARPPGATSANTSKACSAPPGWLVRDRKSGSRPQP